MKRSISVSLLMVMILSLCLPSLCVFAAENEPEVTMAPEDYLSFDCQYDAESHKVTVNGAMNHEAFAHYNNSTLVIYAVPPGKTESEVAKDPATKPLAETDVSISFGFTFKINKLVDRYSRYAIFLRSESGELTLATEAQYPEMPSAVERDSDRSYFKGISTSLATVASEVDAGSVIIPVYLDSLFTDKTNGYIYRIEEQQIFFDKSYIDKIDARMNSLSVSSPRVYFRFLLRDSERFSTGSDNSAEFYMPDLYNEQILLLVHAATDFLISRYDNEGALGVHGIVIGKGWDQPEKYNFCGEEEFDRYVERCVLYAITVANAARSAEPSTDIVIPFTDKGFASEDASLKKTIEGVFDYLDNSFNSGMDCSLIIECTEVPFGISNENIDDGIDLEFDGYSDGIYAGGQKSFSDYISALSKKYRSVPKEYVFLWCVPESLGGNALAVAYTYSYYALLSDAAISCFSVELSRDEDIKEIASIIKLIDTNTGSHATEPLLAHFNENRWTDIKGISDISSKGNKLIYTSTPLFELPTVCKGSFDYFDFSSSMSIDGWNKGTGCNNVRIDYMQGEGKALRADLTLGNVERSELIYLYEYYENMSYTPYLKFDLQINDTAEDSLYEVAFVFENQEKRFETSCIVEGNSENEIVLDMSEYNAFINIENLKISVRSLYGGAESCTLWLHEISGHSEKYSSDELAEKIGQERSKIRDIVENEESQGDFKEIVIVIALLIVTGILSIGLFIVFRKDAKNRSDEE